MVKEKRSYRKALSSHGLIYLGNRELEISVKNLSITGLLAELDANFVITGIEDVFHALESTSTIDLYLPEMRLAGEVNVVRAEKSDGHIYLALEFRNLSYDVNNLVYNRKVYRKSLASSGEIFLNDIPYLFLTQNVSVDGLMVHIKETVDVEEGLVTTFHFQKLTLRGEVKVVWIDHEEDGSTSMGLQYLHMESGRIIGIPRFSSDS